MRRYINQIRHQKALNRKWGKYYRRLKSDQDGIERVLPLSVLTAVKLKLKSDQDGIERVF